jgi:hypothetical protein
MSYNSQPLPGLRVVGWADTRSGSPGAPSTHARCGIPVVSGAVSMDIPAIWPEMGIKATPRPPGWTDIQAPSAKWLKMALNRHYGVIPEGPQTRSPLQG